MKIKVGRPKLPKGDAKDVLIGARFAPDEAEKVEKAARRASQNRSEWVRSVLLNAAG